MQIEYTTEVGGEWQTGCPDAPLLLVKTVLEYRSGSPSARELFEKSIATFRKRNPGLCLQLDGEYVGVHSLRFPVTGDEWDIVNGFRSSRRAWVWPLVYALSAAAAVLGWFLL